MWAQPGCPSTPLAFPRNTTLATCSANDWYYLKEGGSTCPRMANRHIVALSPTSQNVDGCGPTAPVFKKRLVSFGQSDFWHCLAARSSCMLPAVSAWVLCVLSSAQDALPSSEPPKYSFTPSSALNKTARPFGVTCAPNTQPGPVMKPVLYTPSTSICTTQHNGYVAGLLGTLDHNV